jgi:hypothetical protein
MTDWLESVKDIVSLVDDSKAILGIGAGGLALGSVAGFVPRFGLVRALSLGFKSYFKTTYPLSVRKSEIKQLNESILRMKKGSYITVTGKWENLPNRHGFESPPRCSKNQCKLSFIFYCLCEYLIKLYCCLQTKSGASKSVIVDQALRALTGLQFDYFKPVDSARRLLLFYRFLFKRPPYCGDKSP